MPSLGTHCGNTKAPGVCRGLLRGGRYWDRTSDLFRVREARYRCANRPEECGAGGGDGIRTRVDGFAGRCLASRPPHHRGSRLREYPNGGIPSGESSRPGGRDTRADDEIRTRDPHLGKVMRYHCATSACFSGEARSPSRWPFVLACRLGDVVNSIRTRAHPPKSFRFTGRVPRVHAGARASSPRATPGRHVVFGTGSRIRYYRLARQVQRAIGAVGSALRSHRRGHQFESGIAHPLCRFDDTTESPTQHASGSRRSGKQTTPSDTSNPTPAERSTGAHDRRRPRVRPRPRRPRPSDPPAPLASDQRRGRGRVPRGVRPRRAVRPGGPDAPPGRGARRTPPGDRRAGPRE